MLTREKLYFSSIILILLEFYVTCFFGTSPTVSYNVTTIVYGESVIDIYVRYFSQLSITLLFIYISYKFQIKYNSLFLIIFIFILWIMIVPLFVNDNFLTNVKYVFYLLVIIIGINLFKNDRSFIDFNIKMLQIMGLSILFFSIIYIIQFPVPEYRVYRASIMHSNANEDALILAVSFPFLFLLKNRFFKIILILYYVFFLVFYNSTRGAITMSLITILIIQYIKYKKNKNLYIIIVLIFFSLSISIINKYVINDPFFEKGFTAVEENESGNFTQRISGIWIPLIEYTLQKSPILGFGAKKYGELAENITFVTNENGNIIYMERSPHNFFIMFLFNWGLIGLALLLFIYLKYFFIAFNIFKKKYDLLSTAVFSSWISFTGMNFISNSFSYRGWSILVILVLTTHFIKHYKSIHYEFV